MRRRRPRASYTPKQVSALDPSTGIAHLGTSLALEYDKRLMVVSGRANPDLAGRIADKLGVDARRASR